MLRMFALFGGLIVVVGGIAATWGFPAALGVAIGVLAGLVMEVNRDG